MERGVLILQTLDHVVVQVEMIHDTRIILDSNETDRGPAVRVRLSRGQLPHGARSQRYSRRRAAGYGFTVTVTSSGVVRMESSA